MAWAQHLQIEAMKLAFADTYRYVADAALDGGHAAQMLDDAYLFQREADRPPARAGLRRRQPGQRAAPSTSPPPTSGAA